MRKIIIAMLVLIGTASFAQVRVDTFAATAMWEIDSARAASAIKEYQDGIEKMEKASENQMPSIIIDAENGVKYIRAVAPDVETTFDATPSQMRQAAINYSRDQIKAWAKKSQEARVRYERRLQTKQPQ